MFIFNYSKNFTIILLILYRNDILYDLFVIEWEVIWLGYFVEILFKIMVRL